MQSLKYVLAGLLIATPTAAFAQGEGEAAPAPAEGEASAEAGASVGTEAGPATGEAAAPQADAAMTTVNSVMPVGAGHILIAGSTLNINLSADAVGKPISLAPAVYYGVSNKLVVGLTHDGGSTPISPRPGIRVISITIPNPIDPTMSTTVTGAGGAGICLTGEDNGCGKVYDNVGADALFSVAEGKTALAVHGGLDVFSFDPNLLLQLRAGVLGSFAASDKLSIVFDPRISIGLTERDFNKESIDVPVWAWFKVNPKIGAYVHTGIAGPLDGFGDAFRVPVNVGGTFQANDKLGIGADFSFLNLLGKGSTADARMLGLRAQYAL